MTGRQSSTSHSGRLPESRRASTTSSRPVRSLLACEREQAMPSFRRPRHAPQRHLHDRAAPKMRGAEQAPLDWAESPEVDRLGHPDLAAGPAPDISGGCQAHPDRNDIIDPDDGRSARPPLDTLEACRTGSRDSQGPPCEPRRPGEIRREAVNLTLILLEWPCSGGTCFQGETYCWWLSPEPGTFSGQASSRVGTGSDTRETRSVRRHPLSGRDLRARRRSCWG
jgi:hypothetical protein